MADSKITDLTAITGANTDTADVLEIVDVDANASRKITRQELATALATQGVVAQDAIWDAQGDLAVGSGANTSAKLAASTTPGLALITDDADKTLIWGRPSRLAGVENFYRTPSGGQAHFAETYIYPYAGSSSSQTMTSGTVYVAPVWLWEDQTVSYITFYCGTSGTWTNQQFGLYDPLNLTGGGARARLTYTTNDGATAWNSSSAKQLPCAGAGGNYSVTVSGLYWLAVLVTFSAGTPVLTGAPCSSSIGGIGGTVHVGSSTTGQTSLPTSLNAATATSVLLYSGVA